MRRKNYFSNSNLKPAKRIDFSKKNLANPFFQRKRKRKIINFSSIIDFSGTLKKRLFLFISLVLFIFFFWLFFYSSLFAIKNIEINGLSRVPVAEINDIAWQQTNNRNFLIFSQRNIFTFNKKYFLKTIDEKYTFENVEMNKILTHKLSIEIQEKSYAFIWVEGDRYYYSDVDGYIINEVNPLDIKEKKYPIIRNETDSLVSEGEINFDLNEINYIIDLYNKLSDNQYNILAESFVVDRDANTAKIILQSGPVVYFNTQESADKQISKLVILKEEKLKSDFDKKTYIDLRYGEKIYYR